MKHVLGRKGIRPTKVIVTNYSDERQKALERKFSQEYYQMTIIIISK